MRSCALLVWALMLSGCVGASPAGNVMRLEAEKAQLVGLQAVKDRPGYSGDGYVTGFDAAGDKAVFSFSAKSGLYELSVGYSTPNGEKGYEIAVNSSKFSGMLPDIGKKFASQAAGKVELADGSNMIAVEKGWGWYDLDYIELTPAKASPKPKKLPRKLADPEATPATRALMGYLIDQYGSKTLSGQYDQYDQTEVDYIVKTTGKPPAILGGDLMDYSPSRKAHGADPKGHVEQMIKGAREGFIITMCWHWNAPKDLMDTEKEPWWKGFYTEATTFDVKKAMDNPDSEDYKLLVSDIDAIAAQLRKFADAGVPVLWRPMHEAEGGWFWWGAKGPDAYIKLWRVMFDRLTRRHGLHNLIWVHNCVKPEWYPGDAYVDIVGVDGYPPDVTDPLSGTWDDLIKRFDGKKLLAVTEFGGVPDVRKMHRFGARWSFFVTWPGSFGPRKMAKEDLIRIYKDPLVMNRDDLKLPAAAKPKPAF